jgi:hypothetical protein
MKISIIVCTYLLFFTACNRQSQNIFYTPNAKKSQNIPQKPGACYAKMKVKIADEVSTFKLPVYNGVDKENKNVEWRKIVLRDAVETWEKRKSNNCIGNPDDCMVWCKVNLPEQSEYHYIVLDTNIIKDFSIKTFEKIEKINGEEIQWTEVLCEKQITSKLIQDMSMIFMAKGELSTLHNEMNKEFKDALERYQLKNNLAIGGISIEVLQHMGLSY